ncbi:hypothetical protein VSDG_06926 [Cytospora chrysosperma]|uniref:Uncharacterized protein n=1 Tax=Cytospora chrysosperma TaxID=252740 RepID=A0A423VQJ1_CYTCH|nr:hypothetical protein VSDG_06926 [Valsa sordida]
MPSPGVQSLPELPASLQRCLVHKAKPGRQGEGLSFFPTPNVKTYDAQMHRRGSAAHPGTYYERSLVDEPHSLVLTSLVGPYSRKLAHRTICRPPGLSDKRAVPR